jgi:prophage regulatory protein
MTFPVVLRLPVVQHRTGRSRTSIYNDIKAGTFPSPIKLGARSVGWVESTINQWIEERATASQERSK